MISLVRIMLDLVLILGFLILITIINRYWLTEQRMTSVWNFSRSNLEFEKTSGSNKLRVPSMENRQEDDVLVVSSKYQLPGEPLHLVPVSLERQGQNVRLSSLYNNWSYWHSIKFLFDSFTSSFSILLFVCLSYPSLFLKLSIPGLMVNYCL